MSFRPAGKGTLGAVGLVLAVVAVLSFRAGATAGWAEAAVQPAPDPFVPPRPVGTYPAAAARIQGWIDAGQNDSIRRHAWDIWASITAPAYRTQPIVPVTPTFQTWYSGHELFEMLNGQTRLHARAVHGMLDFAAAPSFGHRPGLQQRLPGGIPYDPAERVFAFNRFTKSAADFIWSHKLYSGTFLQDTLAALQSAQVPLASMAILTSTDSTDATEFVLKPVFQFISGKEVTVVPYWAGDDTTATTLPPNPIASTWRHAVAVDPTGRYKAGDSVYLPVNNEPPHWIPVVPLSAFYWVRVTREDSIHFTMFGASNGDLIGLANDTSLQAVLNAARPGNIGLLMAMHVTGKEIANWTWQSFWWAYNPGDSSGAGRPARLGPPWNHYDMTVAYSMTDTANKPIVAFNPYLETSLEGKIPLSLTSTDSLAWTGVTSNCMSCHRRAAIGFANGSPFGPPYGPAMLVSAGDSLVFTQPYGPNGARVPSLKTDFLWSLVVRANLQTTGAARRRP